MAPRIRTHAQRCCLLACIDRSRNPGLICAVLYRMGKDDARQLKLTGFEAGVLPEGVTIKSWETEEKV